MIQSILSDKKIISLREKLYHHPIYRSVKTLKDLQIFMEHHIYSVWDFMSLIKYLQSVIAPTCYPWRENYSAEIRRFINELVLEEESDQDIESKKFTSHFSLYLRAMEEVGATTFKIKKFIELVDQEGIDQALESDFIFKASRNFTKKTFKVIQSHQSHQVAAYLALGREHIIPEMFRSILKDIGIDEHKAPIFYHYLNRHIHLDEDFHGPLSLKLLDELCEGDEIKIAEAKNASMEAIEARIEFWDDVYQLMMD